MFQLFTYFMIDAPYEDGSDDPKDYKFVKWITKDKVSYDILLPINQQLLRKYIWLYHQSDYVPWPFTNVKIPYLSI